MPKHCIRWIVFLSTWLQVTLGLQAAVTFSMVDNLGETGTGDVSVYYDQWVAQSFLSGPFSYQVQSVDAWMGNSSDGDPFTPLPFGELRKATIGGEVMTGPGGLLGTFTIPSLSGAVSVRNFTPTAPIYLEPNTRYFFVVGNNNNDMNSAYDWSQTTSLNFDGTGGGSIPDPGRSFSTDGGVTWSALGSDPMMFGINVATVPEPAQWLAMVMVFTSVGGYLVMNKREQKMRPSAEQE